LIASVQKPEPAGIRETAGGDTSASDSIVKPASPQPKAVKVIRASECSVKTYLENESDIETYLAKLREKLLATIHEGKKARIQ
jgi:hypothetical protein